MNCDQLREIHVLEFSFGNYESLELKNLPNLKFTQLGGCTFSSYCQTIVFESINDWMNDEWDLIRLQSITLGSSTLTGDEDVTETNVLIMKSMNDNDDWLIRSSFSITDQRSWS